MGVLLVASSSTSPPLHTAALGAALAIIPVLICTLCCIVLEQVASVTVSSTWYVPGVVHCIDPVRTP